MKRFKAVTILTTNEFEIWLQFLTLHDELGISGYRGDFKIYIDEFELPELRPSIYWEIGLLATKA